MTGIHGRHRCAADADGPGGDLVLIDPAGDAKAFPRRHRRESVAR
jgi:hypothetical protein